MFQLKLGLNLREGAVPLFQCSVLFMENSRQQLCFLQTLVSGEASASTVKTTQEQSKNAHFGWCK